MIKKIFFLTFLIIFTFNCSQNEVIKTHGVSYLKKREKLIKVNISNKNDAISITKDSCNKLLVNPNTETYTFEIEE